MLVFKNQISSKTEPIWKCNYFPLYIKIKWELIPFKIHKPLIRPSKKALTKSVNAFKKFSHVLLFVDSDDTKQGP